MAYVIKRDKAGQNGTSSRDAPRDTGTNHPKTGQKHSKTVTKRDKQPGQGGTKRDKTGQPDLHRGGTYIPPP
jgi:hypothetical protein